MRKTTDAGGDKKFSLCKALSSPDIVGGVEVADPYNGEVAARKDLNRSG